MDLAAALDEMAAATDGLLLTVDALDDAALREPSLLPGWTRAHVLTHIARNADGMVNLVAWARTGEEVPMYAGGREGRDADIEAGAGRHIGDIRLDLTDSAERLLQSFAGFPDEGLDREVALASGATAYGWEIPSLRVREVEIHHVDLGSGYSTYDWSPEFAARTLDQLSPLFRDARDCPVGTLVATDGEGRWEVAAEGPELAGPRTALVAWLTGRGSDDRLALSPAGPVPAAPKWV
ncbi:MAG: maleylpyruvate isomerase family mycothiol-dependent enzyme [Sporichthyaceae bacterium]|nr:maleylpyruvate isomerase family mycothiol-dependent enzyme [Sporichthyaceae bacterium]